MFDCFLFKKEVVELKAKTKYKILDFENCLLMSENSMPTVLSFESKQKNFFKVDNHGNTFYFVFATKHADTFFTTIKCFSSELQMILNNNLIITKNGEIICEVCVDNISYSHYELKGEFCLIYFYGERNYVVALNKDGVCFSSHYDEYNESEGCKLFMCRLRDSLNHGRVFKLNDKTFESYLIYLDENDLNLKKEFVPFVFLDCVKAQNFKYSNMLLCDELKLKNEQDIKLFFPEFDDFYPISESEFVLIKKNTLAGIFEFSVKNLEIVNLQIR